MSALSVINDVYVTFPKIKILVKERPYERRAYSQLTGGMKELYRN